MKSMGNADESKIFGILEKSEDQSEEGSTVTEYDLVLEKIVKSKEELESLDLEQNIRLKKITLAVLFSFLGAETVAVFLIAFFQGFEVGGFALEEWNFRLMIAGTIMQITFMLQIAVKHLFPLKEEKEG